MKLQTSRSHQHKGIGENTDTFKEQIVKMKLPPIHISEGKEYFLDPLRERLIYKTPEEVVRQQVIRYLLDVKKVPKNMIQVEMLLAKYDVKSIRRADIIIERFSQTDKSISPLAVVECKAPEIMLGDSAIEQACDYADKLVADYLIITNGHELIVAKYVETKKQYIDLSTIPTYEEMLNGKGDILEAEPPKERFSFDELIANQDYYRGYDFNANTPTKFLPFLTNLLECFIDVSHKMPCKEYKYFTLIEDYGIRWLSCGNAAGGSYQGAYRSFLIKHGDSTKFMNLAFFDYGTHTILTVSTDQEDNKPHNSLQYAIETNLIKNGDSFHFLHSGRIAVGNIGSGKVSELKALIAEKYPSILINDKIDLGTLQNTELLYMDNPSVVCFVEKCLTYAIIRDEYREQVKNQTASRK